MAIFSIGGELNFSGSKEMFLAALEAAGITLGMGGMVDEILDDPTPIEGFEMLTVYRNDQVYFVLAIPAGHSVSIRDFRFIESEVKIRKEILGLLTEAGVDVLTVKHWVFRAAAQATKKPGGWRPFFTQ